MAMKTCKECGTEISENEKFCHNCGKPNVKETLDEKSINSKESVKASEDKEKITVEKKKHVISWIVCVFMFLSTVLTNPYSIANIFMFLCGLFACPPFFNYINSKYNNKLKKSIRIIICIAMTILAISTMPESSESEINNSNGYTSSNVLENSVIETEKEKADREAKEKAEKEEKEKKEKEEATKKAKEDAEAKKKSEKEFKDSCKKYTFKEIARNPDKYQGKKMKFTGEVIQVSEGWFNSVDIRLNVTKNEYGWYEDTIYCTYTYKEGEGKILEDDIVTIYGTCDGDYTYTSVMGASITLPKINIEYITIK